MVCAGLSSNVIAVRGQDLEYLIRSSTIHPSLSLDLQGSSDVHVGSTFVGLVHSRVNMSLSEQYVTKRVIISIKHWKGFN